MAPRYRSSLASQLLQGIVVALEGEFWQALAGDVEQVVAVLGQQVQSADDVGDVAGVGLFEAQAIQGFEQVAGGADALAGGVEDFEGVGFGVDDHTGVSL